MINILKNKSRAIRDARRKGHRKGYQEATDELVKMYKDKIKLIRLNYERDIEEKNREIFTRDKRLKDIEYSLMNLTQFLAHSHYLANEYEDKGDKRITELVAKQSRIKKIASDITFLYRNSLKYEQKITKSIDKYKAGTIQ